MVAWIDSTPRDYEPDLPIVDRSGNILSCSFSKILDLALDNLSKCIFFKKSAKMGIYTYMIFSRTMFWWRVIHFRGMRRFRKSVKSLPSLNPLPCHNTSTR